VTPARDFHIAGGSPRGHWILQATISSTGARVSRVFPVDGYGAASKRKWTPWVGATDLDHTAGAELVLGAQGAADAAVYQVVVYWAGTLRTLPSPDAADPSLWPVVGAYLHGTGYRCRAHSLVTTAYAANRHVTRWHFRRSRYVWSDNRWHAVATRTRTAHARKEGKAPRGAFKHFYGFHCPGLRHFS